MKNFKHYKLFYLFIFLSICDIGTSISLKEDLTLTMEQKRLLDKFKKLVVDKLPEDYMKQEIFLIKWLRSSNFQLEVAERRILSNVTWRKKHNMDSIQSEDFSDVNADDFRYYNDGKDKLGRPYLLLDVRNMDLRRAVLQGKEERLLRYTDKAYDEGCTKVRMLGEKYGNMTRGHLLVDLEGYNPVQHACLRCIPFLIRVLFAYLEHWPECVDKIITVNSPVSIQQLVIIAKPLIDETLRKSIFIYGVNRNEWMKALAQDFDRSELPPTLGGTKILKGMEFDEFR